MKYLKSFETMQFAALKNAKDIADKEKERRDKKEEETKKDIKPESSNKFGTDAQMEEEEPEIDAQMEEEEPEIDAQMEEEEPDAQIEETMKYLKRFNENLNLSDFPYINADDDEILFVDEEIRKYLGIEPRLSEEELDELSDEDYEAYFDREDRPYDTDYVANIPGKLEIHGNHVYYDESDKEIMKIMVGIFPNDFRNGVRVRE